MHHIITITGIRPDFIRMSRIFKKLDENFKHTMIHTGQHFDFNLSDVFFKDLEIRKPDYNFAIGKESSDHFEQLAHLSLKIKEYQDLIESADLVLFLGDSNSVLAAPLIRKMKIKVGHIEAGMRCGNMDMFEEINRITCDHVSDILFCYTPKYVDNLVKENISSDKIHMVGNTITEVVMPMVPDCAKRNDRILLDVHRQENFLNESRLRGIIDLAKRAHEYYGLPVEIIGFKRTITKLIEFGIDINPVKICQLMSFPDYIDKAYHSKLVISDSGTAQEELAFLKTPVIVPRDQTERKESIDHHCSKLLRNVGDPIDYIELFKSLEDLTFDVSWLGDGNTSEKIVQIIRQRLNNTHD